jgi:hypothetical protein
MEARGLQLIATKAISSLMIEGKMPSASLTAQAETNATTNLIMELFAQVTAEAEQSGAAEGIALRVQATFLELGRVEQEADSFIGVAEGAGVVEGSLIEEESTATQGDVPGEDREDGEVREDGEDDAESDVGFRWSAPAAPAREVTPPASAQVVSAAPTPLFGEFAPDSPATDAGVASPPAEVATAGRAEALGDGRLDMQRHRSTWEEMRARLEQEVAGRKRGRARHIAHARSKAPVCETTTSQPASSLWEVAPPTPPSAVDASDQDQDVVDHAGDQTQAQEAAADRQHLPTGTSEQPAPSAETGGPLGQLSLFG